MKLYIIFLLFQNIFVLINVIPSIHGLEEVQNALSKKPLNNAPIKKSNKPNSRPTSRRPNKPSTQVTTRRTTRRITRPTTRRTTTRLTPRPITNEQLPAYIFQETNKYRSLHGAKPRTNDRGLLRDSKLCAEERAKRNDKEDKGFFKTPIGVLIVDYAKKGEASKLVGKWYNTNRSYNFRNPQLTDSNALFVTLVYKNSTKMGCGASDNGDTTYVCCLFEIGDILDNDFAKNVSPRRNNGKK
uniref:SCP domain-containing protein n=1 Tax=Parastrongyloides trichosuri TaxID=131310 RepID=A0A0N4ZGD9_PARTI